MLAQILAVEDVAVIDATTLEIIMDLGIVLETALVEDLILFG